MGVKHPFDHDIGKKATAGTNDLRMGPVESGWLYCVQFISVENETNDYTELEILKSTDGHEFKLEAQASPEAATLYWMTDDIYLHEGQSLILRLTGCTADDVLRAYVTGWRKVGYAIDKEG